MNPHDKWNSRDIAQFGRMSMHVTDYAEPPKPAKRTPGLVLIFAGLIAVLFTLMIAHLVVRSGVAGGW